jgi:hypothetical protein
MVRTRRPADTGGMTATAQGWVLLGILGVLATGLLTVMGLAVTGLRSELAARFAVVDQRFTAVDQRFEALTAVFAQRFDGVDRRLDALDRDVPALTDRVLRDRP